MSDILRQLTANLIPTVSGGAYQDAREVSIVWNTRRKHRFLPRVYLKTPNAPGQRTFSRCAAPFFLEIRQYSCEKMSCSAQKFLAAGHIGSFQIHPKFRCRMHQTRPSTLFSPVFSLAREKIGPPEARQKRPRRNEPPQATSLILCARFFLSKPQTEFAVWVFPCKSETTSQSASLTAPLGGEPRGPCKYKKHIL